MQAAQHATAAAEHDNSKANVKHEQQLATLQGPSWCALRAAAKRAACSTAHLLLRPAQLHSHDLLPLGPQLTQHVALQVIEERDQ